MAIGTNVRGVTQRILDHVRECGHTDISLKLNVEVSTPLCFQCNECELTWGRINPDRASCTIHLKDPPPVHRGLWRFIFDTDGEVNNFLDNFLQNLKVWEVANPKVAALVDTSTLRTRFDRNDVV